ncbi:hypothetical protein H072_5457 [Dactylellina haptotyla CBS 200.50]|uniref:Uncharacterized protein n=1 Tax=Dactylellina haptotyla (strain CBS 200.50) TaxID=1284197 RepID=S8AHN0_DACHA|nr:hypothetical protein H072_5457 [Dactylellina haptotyla CBS 200.50]
MASPAPGSGSGHSGDGLWRKTQGSNPMSGEFPDVSEGPFERPKPRYDQLGSQSQPSPGTQSQYKYRIRNKGKKMTSPQIPTTPSNPLIEYKIPPGAASNWYSQEGWSKQQTEEQEERAAGLIGDLAQVKATLEYYCANDIQHHGRWVSILAEHITLLAEAKGLYLNAAVAYQVSQQKASKYRQSLETSTIESEAKRPIKQVEGSSSGSMRGKRKMPRIESASISKGTHPFNKKSPNKRTSPLKNTLAKSDEMDEGNFKLVGPDDFLKTLKLPEKSHKDFFILFRQLRDDIFKRMRNNEPIQEPLFFVQTPSKIEPSSLVRPPNFQAPGPLALPSPDVATKEPELTQEVEQPADPEPMDIDIPRMPGQIDNIGGRDKCIMQ